MKTSHAGVGNSLLLVVLAVAFVRLALPGEPGQLKWSFATGAPVYSCPALGMDGTVYLTSGKL